ncbi:hypothetical protein AB3Z07_04985 [Metabacillus halosaccharovorans]|uniref:hypothetical protein n=1 Tax=Metabacillus halosaccharovorans TaxID=930124 RepID=UPI0034CE4475
MNEDLHPLKIISATFSVPLAKVADELGIRRQSVNEWVGKRRKSIPEKHIPKLSNLFQIDERWFRKEALTDQELIELNVLKLTQEVKRQEDPNDIKEMNKVFVEQMLIRAKEVLEKNIDDVFIVRKLERFLDIHSSPEGRKGRVLSVITQYLSVLYDQDIETWQEKEKNNEFFRDLDELLIKHKYK